MKNNYKPTLVVRVSLCIIVFFTVTIYPMAQVNKKLVSGTVTDIENNPLPGVNVLIKNKNRGTTTQLNGSWKLMVTSQDTLVFSFLGFKPINEPVGNKTTINVQLREDATALDQVVLNAGYYKVSNKEKTGSITSVTAKEIENQPVTNSLAALQGRMTGVNIQQTSGLPGSGFNVQIRGKNSITAGTDPLYIIDGVPFNPQSLSAPDVSGNLIPSSDLSPFSFLNPTDIESIEVLKDADATAIYGSRGANGVVLITTKNSSGEKTRFTLSAQSGLGGVANTQKLLNTTQYLEMRRQAFSNDGMTEYPPNAYDINGTWDQNRYTDWQKILLGGTAYNHKYNATVSGGNKNTSFFLSGGYQNETTVFPGDNFYKRANGLAKVNHNAADDNFKVSLSTAYSIENNKLPGGDLSFQALTLPPNAPQLYKEDGNLNWEEGTFNNPLGVLEGEYKTKRNSLLVNAQMEYTLLKGLVIKANAGYQYSSLSEYHTYPHTQFNPFFGLDSSSSAIYTNEGARSSWIAEPQIAYRFKSGEHALQVLAGFSAQQESNTRFAQYASGFASNALIRNTGAASFLQVTQDDETLYKYEAVFGRVNYSYGKRYLLNITARRDGSSRFGNNDRFANFGALGMAWIFSEEQALKDKLPFLSYGKIRTSYGTTGNDQIGDYKYLDTYSTNGIAYNGTIGLSPTALYNPDFGWEVNRKAEAAFELGLFKNRILTTVNYYNNRSSNQLVEVPLPGTTGFTGVLANLDALIENTGWEFELNSTNIKTENWRWSTSFNLTLPENKLLEFPNLENSTYANSYVIGEPITIQKVLRHTGVDPESGTHQFEDFNGDGQISIPEDSQAQVDTAPTFYGGLGNTLSYGNFEIDAFFQFSKQKALNNKVFGTTPGVLGNQPVDVLDAWQEPGDITNTQAFTSGSNPERSLAYFYLSQSDAAYSDASYIRLKNVALTYTIKKVIKGAGNAKVFIQGQNLVTWTPYKGQDPEQTQGFLPPLRWVQLGLSLTF